MVDPLFSDPANWTRLIARAQAARFLVQAAFAARIEELERTERKPGLALAAQLGVESARFS